MLHITTVHDSKGQALKLAGKLLAPWTDEVRAACTDLAAQSAIRRLDLRDVSYVDSAGIKLLQALHEEGFDLSACSLFVAAVLHTETP